MDLRTNIAGIELENPLMPASGPLVGSYEKMMAIAEFEVPRPCIIANSNSIMNAELWSEYPMKYWINIILPDLRKDLKIPLILSVGYSKEDMEVLIPALEGYCDAFEVSTHYVGKDLSQIGETVRTITALTNKPVFMKISPHIPDVVAFAKVVQENGAKGIVAINSLGPTLKLDAAKRRVLMGNESGEVWTSGPAIKPVALAIVNKIKTAMPNFTVIGAGGIESATDIVEFLLAGADAVQMLSAAMLRGKDLYQKILKDLPVVLTSLNFKSVKEVVETPLQKGNVKYQPSHPVIDHGKCNLCGICERICPYFALEITNRVVVNIQECFGCGLCESKCPAKAMSGVL